MRHIKEKDKKFQDIKITWSVATIGQDCDSHCWECEMYGEDEEGNSYTGFAEVVDAHTNPEWDDVQDIEKEG
jgi:hypothetical protein